MAPKRRGIRARMYDERALLRQAKAIIKPVGRFLRRDPQRSRTTISTDLLGNPYNNHCREPSHQRLVHPRFHAGRSRAGLQALRTDPDPSPSRGSHPPASLRRKVSFLNGSIPRFQQFGGDGVRGSAQYRRRPGDGIRPGRDGESTMVLLHAEACGGQSSSSTRRHGLDIRARPSWTLKPDDSKSRN